MKPGYHKVGSQWYDCNDAGLKQIEASNCGNKELEQTWDEGNLIKRCDYRSGKMVIIDIYCIFQGKQVSPNQVVVSNVDAKSGMICRQEKNGSLVWQLANETEVDAWLKR